jgi:8-amino-3,8-dideoxy-alpha-D-manno-octulosonate transaminase
LDPADVAARITERTAAIVPVHLENVACELDSLLEVAAARGLQVVEDAAQAIGVTYRGRAVGTFGALGAFSLQATKTITTGEGGVVVTDDADRYVRAARFSDQGGQFVTQYRGSRGPEHGDAFCGDNLRMTEVAGALGAAQLARLPALLAAMRTNAARVAGAVGEIDGLVPRRLPDPAGAGGSSLTWFAPTAGLARHLVAALRAEGVPAAQMYEGRTLAHNPALAARRTASGRGGPWHCAEHPTDVRYEPGMLPVSEDLAARSVTVGIGPAFTQGDCDDVAAGIHKVTTHVLAGAR